MVLDPSLQTCKYYRPPERFKKKKLLIRNKGKYIKATTFTQKKNENTFK